MKTLFCLAFAFLCSDNTASETDAINTASLQAQKIQLSPASNYYSSAAILQYHHVSDSTPPSTSVTPQMFVAHLDWLEDNHFIILPLDKVISTLQAGKSFEHNRVVSITFDDANLSVCDEAWPILKKREIPFTLFINSGPLEKGFSSQCSWDDLKAMQDSELMIAGNHAHSHLYMIRDMHKQSQSAWENTMREEILKTERLIEKHLGIKTDYFAYPYGEYNTELEALVKELGYIGFGQHSGAVGHESDFLGLPRFPASGQFAKLETLSTKLNSLAFPAEVKALSENPIALNAKNNPPILQLTLKQDLKNVNCFDSSTGEQIPTQREGNVIITKNEHPLTEGRHRYNCTSASNEAERFYWISHQWVVEDR